MRSVPIFCHGRVGISCGINGSFLCDFASELCSYVALSGKSFNVIVDAWPEDRGFCSEFCFLHAHLRNVKFFSGYPAALIWESISFLL